MAIAWAELTESPGLAAYQKLKRSADRTGQWPAWREKALALLRETIAGAKRQPPKDHWGPAVRVDHSQLVEILLWEGDVEAAWREAKEGGCHDSLWLRFAAEREEEHPEDAISVYTEQLEPTLRFPDKDAYREAVGLLREIRQLMSRLGKENEFASLVRSVRAQHKPKRNLMKLLDAEGWQ